MHIIFVVTWFAGLFYLPRLFIYHVENIQNKESVEIFKKMELRLLKLIMNPAMIATWIFGIGLIHHVGLDTWLYVKICLVIILSCYHMYLGKIRKNLFHNLKSYSSKYIRYTTEILTLLLVFIVILVVIMPF